MKIKMNILYILHFAIMIVIVQSCTPPRINRRYSNKINRQKWEKILRQTEQEYNTLSAKNLLSHIRMFLGTSYRKGGNTIRGMDCSGFVMTVYKKASNINLPHNAAMMYKQTTYISLKEVQFGDLLFFENYKSKGIFHVAIYLTDSNFVHASISHGVTISNLNKDYYRQRFKGTRRVANLRLK